MAKRILRGFEGLQTSSDVVGFDKDKLRWDWSMKDKNDENNEEDTEEREEYVSVPNNNSSDNQNNSQTEQEQETEQESEQKQENKSTTNKSKRSAFGQAFDKARAAGKKTFWWRGKEYNTKTKAEADAEKKSASNKNTSSKTNSNRTSSTNNSTSNKQHNATSSTTNKKVTTNTNAATNTKAASDKRNTEIVKRRASNFENNLNRYGSRNKFEFKQNYQAPKKETTPQRKARPSDAELMRGLKRLNAKRIRSYKNNPVYKSKGTKLENMLGM